MNWKWMVVIVLLALLLIFTLQNHTTVEVQFLFWSFSTSRAIVIFSSVFIGIIIGLISSIIGKDL
ncbi:MAG: lipopolysaccharide assembly protein LapA domain-containing protein [Candidatus Omnitrophota bacterium]